MNNNKHFGWQCQFRVLLMMVVLISIAVISLLSQSKITCITEGPDTNRINDLQQTIERLNKSIHTLLNTSAKYRIICPIKIHLDDFNLIEYSDPALAHKFDKYLNPKRNYHCTESIYRYYFHDCCTSQFAINYLYSLGFTQIRKISKVWKASVPFEHKIMVNHKNNALGCLGLKVQYLTPTESRFEPWLTETAPAFDKIKSYNAIMQYCKAQAIDTLCQSFLPITYDLQISSERIAFFRHLPCNNKPNNAWLLKTMQHRGDGIHFIENPNGLRNYYLSKWEQNISNPQCVTNDSMGKNLEREIIAQQLIKSARINECTFHIRAYIFVANYANPLIVLLAGSIVLRSTDPREIRTNYHQRKANSTANANDTLPYFFNLSEVSEYFGKASFNPADIVAQIKSATKVLFLAALDGSVPKKHMHSGTVQHHMMPALDFVVTEDDFSVKWLDYNLPSGSDQKHCFEEKESKFGIKVSLSHDWRCTEGKRMMEEMIDIEIEIAIKKRNKMSLDTLDSVKSFQVIIWQ